MGKLKCPRSQIMDLGGGLPGVALGKVGKLKCIRGQDVYVGVRKS